MINGSPGRAQAISMEYECTALNSTGKRPAAHVVTGPRSHWTLWMPFVTGDDDGRAASTRPYVEGQVPLEYIFTIL